MMNTKFLLLLLNIPLLFISCKNAPQTEDDQIDEENVEQAVPSATLLWKSDTTFTGSESALYDADKDVIYVSCGNTNASAKDGVGFIAVIQPDGIVKNMTWTTGLNAPKGMAIMDNSLYVTDIDEMVQIDLSSGKITNKYPITNAEFLNDAATDGSYVYFSDMRQNKVYRLKNGKYELVAENVPKINGLESYKGTLYGLNEEGLIKFDNNGGYEILSNAVKGGDGLVILDDDTFIATRWIGEIYYMDGDEVTKIVDTSPEKSNTADIGYISDKKIIIVPTFLKNEVAAYQLDTGSGK